jgi:hypothetical protein
MIAPTEAVIEQDLGEDLSMISGTWSCSIGVWAARRASTSTSTPGTRA